MRMSTQQNYGSVNSEGATDQDLLHEVAIPENLWSIIGSLWVGTFLASADSTIVATAANTIASSMNNSEGLTWIATSYLVTNTIFQPLVGKFSDVFGRKTVLIVAQFWFAVGCLYCALARSVTEFAIARAIAGIGGGGMSALSSIITTDVIPLRMRGVYQGYSNMMYSVGQFSGPIIASFFLTMDPDLGWRWMFILQVPFVIVAAYLVNKNVHDYRTDQTYIKLKDRLTLANFQKIDLPGSFFLSGAIVSLLMFFNSETSFQGYVWSALLILSSICFYIVEKYIMTVHVIPPDAFKGVLKITAFIVFCGASAIYSLSYLLPLYFQIVLGFTQVDLGIFNTFVVFTSGGGSLLAGWLLNHKESVGPDVVVKKAIKLTLYCCIGFFIGTAICLVTISQNKPAFTRDEIRILPLVLILSGNIITGLSYGAFLVILLILVVGKVGIKHQASVTGMNYMFRSMGQSSGVGISLSFYQHILTSELEHYFLNKKRPDGPEVLKKLTESTFYIRNGLPMEYVKKTLKIYKAAMTDSFILLFVITAITIVLALSLKLYPAGNKPKTIL